MIGDVQDDGIFTPRFDMLTIDPSDLLAAQDQDAQYRQAACADSRSAPQGSVLPG